MNQNIRIQNINTQVIVAEKGIVADSFWTRLIGLMGRVRFENGEAIFFPRCSSIHMWFMRMAIDVAFLRRDSARPGFYQVTKLVSGARPWSVLPFADFKATDVLELPKGTIQRASLKSGDVLCIS